MNLDLLNEITLFSMFLFASFTEQVKHTALNETEQHAFFSLYICLCFTAKMEMCVGGVKNENVLLELSRKRLQKQHKTFVIGITTLNEIVSKTVNEPEMLRTFFLSFLSKDCDLFFLGDNYLARRMQACIIGFV